MITILKKNSSRFLICLSVMFCCVLTSCQNTKSLSHLSKEDKHNTKYNGHFKVGNKYQIKGKSYTPKKYDRYSMVGMASWYGSKRDRSHGKKTANGDIYNKNMLTAAHRTLHLPSLVKIKNLENGKTLIVLVNDRGPFHSNREIDVSEKAAILLGFKKKGVAKVKVQYLASETDKLLKTFGLDGGRDGSISKRALPNKKCSVNCHIKLVNLKYGIDISS